jgi:predicted transcriptional regulator
MLTSAKKLEGVTKTKIMFESYLSHAQLKDYLALLIENGMLERNLNNKFQTTEKGMKMLDAYQNVNDLVSVEHD